MSAKVLAPVLVVCVALAASVAYADIETGLVGYWPLDGDATDESGNGLDGTINGDVTPVADRSAEPDSAMQFSGASDAYIDVGDPPELQLTGEMTLASWVYLDSSNSNNGRIVGKMAGGGSRSWSLNIEASSGGITNPGNFFVASDGNTLVNVMTQDSLPTDEWVHLAGIYRPGEALEIYVNGVLDNANTSGIPASQFSTNGQPVYVGNRTACTNCGWLGFLDEVRIYERALSEAEVRQVMTGNVVSAGPDQWIEAGSSVTLYGSGPEDATSFTWEQIIVGDEPTITIDDPHSSTITFLTPVRDIGYILTLRLTVVSPSEGTNSDEGQIYVRAPNEPRVTPGNFRTYPSNLGYRLEWDWLIDAQDYGVGLKVAEGTYFWFSTPNTYYDLLNLTEGQGTDVAVRAENKYGDGPISDDVTLIPMRNYALPATLGGTMPPSDHIYLVSHYTITDMNNNVMEDDNDSWDGSSKSEDYWGYLWPQPMYFDHVTYFTGNMFADGGWFTDLRVQYTKDGDQWLDVPTTVIPDYDFTDQRSGKQRYTRYDMYIPILYGTGVRIYGTPGGASTFTSISELEVYADMVTSRPLVIQGVDGEVPERSTGTIDASFSFSTRGDITSMIYEQLSGPSVTITVTGDPLIATFEAPGVDADTELVFQLTGSDGTDTLTDEVTMTVKNLVTTAVAGPDQSVEEGTTASLDGSASLSTTDTLTYQWSQTSGDPVTLDNPTDAVCTFEAPAAIWDYTEDLTFRLDVDDGAGGTSSDEVTVEVRNSLAWPAWPYTDAAAPTTGYMTDLLHLGNNPTDRILAPLDIDLSTSDPLAKWGGQAFVNPVPGDAYDFTDTGFTVTRNPMVWTPIHSDDGWFGDEGLDYFQQMYHVYVISPDERAARLHARYDDEVRIWNNGTLIYSDDAWDQGEEHQADTTLYEGLNSVTFKFEEGSGGNQIAVGFTDEFDSLMPDVWYSLGPSFILTDAYAVRKLPSSYQPGASIDIELSVRVDPANKPSNVTITEPIPAGLTVVDAGGGTVVGSSLNWAFGSGSVVTQVVTYTLGVPGGVSGSLNFPGTIAFSGTTDTIKGDNVIYQTPGTPETVYVEMLVGAHLNWTPSLQEGVVGYRVYRSENGQPWEEIAFVSGTSYTDGAIAEGNTYNYQVAAVNAAGVEGNPSAPTGEKMIVMEIRQAEDYNYGGGQWPGYEDCPAAIEAPDAATVGTPYEYDFFFATDVPAGDARLDYRPNDNCGTELREATVNIGWTTVGDWWRYTFNVPAPGADDPPEGWVRVVLKVSAPSDTTVDLYWDEVLVDSLSFVTGDWGIFQDVSNEEYFQSTPGVHTLRVVLASGGMNFDTIGMGFNWSAPTRETLFEDDFEEHTVLYDTINGDWTVINGSGVFDGAWRLWNTGGSLLGNESPALAAMTDNYAITDSDLAGAVDADEELITPTLDCTGHRSVRLNFTMNYKRYIDDVDHDQIADVDVRSSEDGVTWGNWTNLLRWDINTVADTASGAQEVDLSAHADGQFIQVRWRFHEANYDYWFAIDDIRVSGDKGNGQPPVEGPPIRYRNGVAEIWWYAFGTGNYTVEYTDDLTSAIWNPVPGVTWPITRTAWSGDITAIFAKAVYLRVRSE